MSTTRRNNRFKQSQQRQVATALKIDKVVHPSPPEHDSSHHYVTRIRFRTTNPVVQYPIYASDIATLLSVATESVTGQGPVNCVSAWTRVKVKKIEAWAIPTTLASAATVSLSLLNVSGTTTNNSERTSTDTSSSLDRYAYAWLKPRTTYATGQWFGPTQTGAGFGISAPGNTIVDITLHAYINNADTDNTLVVWFNTGVQISDGTMFIHALDSSATSSGYFEPIGYYNNVSDQITPTPRL